MRKIYRLLAFALLLFALPALADVVLLLESGERVRISDGVTYNGKAFQLPDGVEYLREQVSEVRFENTPPSDLLAWKYDAARYEKLFAKGQELAARYPNRPGVILEDLSVVRLENDGTQSTFYHFTGLVLKEKAKAWANVFSGGDPIRTLVDGPYGVVVHPDGTYRAAAESDRSSYNPYSGAVFFSRYTVYKLAIPDVNVGDIVEYWYKTTDFKPINPDFFFPSYYFQDDSPVALSRIEVRVPAGKQLYFQVQNFPTGEDAPKMKKDAAGGTFYSWEMKDVPPFESEPNMPNRSELLPNIRATVMTNWDPIFDHLTEFYRTRMIATDDIRRLTEKIVGDATDVHEKISRIYQFAQREIRYISIKTDFGTGFTGHAAEVTLANGYGDCTDKSIVLSTMLGVIGIEAHPIFLQTWGGRRDIYSLPNLGGNHSITKVFLEGREFFLDATAETYRYPFFRWDDHGCPYVDPLGRKVGIIDRPPSPTNLDRESWTLELNAQGGAHVKRKDFSTGIFEAMLRDFVESMPDDKRRISLQQQILRWGAGAQLILFRDENRDDLSQQLIQHVEFTLPQLAQQAGGMWVIELPALPTHFGVVDNETRRSDLLSPFFYQTQRDYHVKLPPNWKLVDYPKKETIETTWFRFVGEYKPTAEGFDLIYTIDNFNDATVTPEQYPTYREAMVNVETFFSRSVFAQEVSQ